MQAVDSAEPTLSEEFVQECFHSYLKSSLTHAKVEGLLDESTLSSAEADLMITGPALCLYFAALRSTTNPPSVPLPRRSKNGSPNPPADLSFTNCPPAFRQFLLVWSELVPSIQGLNPEHQHDLARIICGLEPQSSPLNRRLNGVAADLRAVAIEISMRRTFQEKYANDLQVAIDSGAPRSPGGRQLRASFVPPPRYDDASTHHHQHASADAPPPPLPPKSPPSSTLTVPPHSYSSPSSPSSYPPPLPSRRGHSPTPSTSSIGSSRSAKHSEAGSELFSPTILADEVPGIEFVRETLYAALAEVLERKPHLRRMLRADPARAYFSAVSLAILDVAASSATRPDDSAARNAMADVAPLESPLGKARDRERSGAGGRTEAEDEGEGEPVIRGVLGQQLALSACPAPLRPFMVELCAIGRKVHEMEDEDSEAAVGALQRGEEPPVPRLERVYEIVEKGVGQVRSLERGWEVGGSERNATRDERNESGEPRRRRTSTEGRAVAFANRINALALGMTKLSAFRQRQETVFRVLAGVGS